MENEADVVSKLCQPGQSNTVVEVYNHDWFPGPDQSYYYVDMEYCEQTLEEWIKDSTRHQAPQEQVSNTAIPSESKSGLADILDIIEDITSGLQYLHQQGIVHRDLKPKNGTFPSPQC